MQQISPYILTLAAFIITTLVGASLGLPADHPLQPRLSILTIVFVSITSITVMFIANQQKGHRPMTADPALSQNLEELTRMAFEIGATVAFIIREPEKITLYSTVAANCGENTALVILFADSAPGRINPDIEMITPESLEERSKL